MREITAIRGVNGDLVVRAHALPRPSQTVFARLPGLMWRQGREQGPRHGGSALARLRGGRRVRQAYPGARTEQGIDVTGPITVDIPTGLGLISI